MASDERRVASESPATIAGYVLAGGASRRFGKDKALVDLGGKSMLARMIAVMRGNVKKTRIVASPEKYAEFREEVVEDRWPGEGPLGGILTALLHTQENQPGCEWNLIVSCDMPFLTEDWLKFLTARAAKSTAQVVLAHSDHGPEPLCAVWRTDGHATIRAEFDARVRKVAAAIGKLKSEVLDERDWKRFDSAGRLFWNMNTAADYEEARRIVDGKG